MVFMHQLQFHLHDGSSLVHSLEEGITTLGRHPDSIVVLDFPSVSRYHAVLELGPKGCVLVDKRSRNGTRVNGAKIHKTSLKNGDSVTFGHVQATYTDS
jgi:pSer/pThr/pTyr-binding forkhead associated (FHA) protein